MIVYQPNCVENSLFVSTGNLTDSFFKVFNAKSILILQDFLSHLIGPLSLSLVFVIIFYKYTIFRIMKVGFP